VRVLEAAREAAVRAGEVGLEAELDRLLFSAVAQGNESADALAVPAEPGGHLSR
jgi:hypothetical protein